MKLLVFDDKGNIKSTVENVCVFKVYRSDGINIYSYDNKNVKVDIRFISYEQDGMRILD